jgi:uncharacterized protein YraI
MKHLRILAFAATALIGAATAATAQEAYTTNDVSMRAGPGTRYPVVRRIPEDAVVFIHGCLRNWDWCDVSWRRSRGWVFSDYLEGLYGSRRLGFDEWRDYVELPYVSFSFGYWDRYYRDRPWYGNWERWGDRNDRDWRRHHRDDNDNDSNWNDNDNNTDGTWNRTDSDTQGDRTTRRKRNTEDNQDVTRCAPDDPTCDAGSNNNRRRNRNNQPMDNQQMDDQQQ